MTINRAIKRVYEAYNKEEQEKAKEEHREPVIIPHFSVHNLRHTFCTRFCENETNLKVIQEIMGHADITTTMNIYNEATEDKKQKAFQNLDGKIKIS
jgi:integrase